jgi:hypothetical protein
MRPGFAVGKKEDETEEVATMIRAPVGVFSIAISFTQASAMAVTIFA